MKNLWLILPIGVILFFAGKYIYHIPEFSVGGDVPNFQVKLENGNAIDLYQFAEDKILLVEFWGSWCGPCRASNKGLVKVYDKFANKKGKDGNTFEILSIALEQRDNQVLWAKAVATDGLQWDNHVRQLWGKSALRDLYKITEVPSNYLIGKGGKILGVNMTEKELEKYLQDNLVM